MTNNSIKFCMVLLCLIFDIFWITIYLHSICLKGRLYRNYKELFKNFKVLHKGRYKLYFCGKKSEIDEYTQMIEESAKVLLDVGEYMIQKKHFNKREIEEIQKIMKQTIKLLETNQS